jgi:hypothetical protein
VNAIVPQNFGPVATRFQGQNTNNDLAGGVASSYGIVGYKGKVWSIRYRGESTPLMRPDGDGPVNSIEVVIVKASPHLSKIFYENGYQEGSSAAPDCFSNNGITPDASAQKKQATACASCPKNAWGSRITPAGKNGKACSDSKRVAVVPLQDVRNEVYGGPMLLRVPAASLQDLAGFGSKMNGLGYPYYAIGTRVAFDPKESYPKFVFSAIRPLTDGEADAILAMQNDPATARVLSEAESYAAQAPVQPVVAPSPFEQPAAPAPAPVAPAAPIAAAPTAPAPIVVPVQQELFVEQPAAPATPIENELDAKLAALLPN